MSLDRRQFLLAALASPALAARQRDTAPLLDRGFARVTQFAPGVYVTIADSAKGPQCASNGGVLAGRDRVLIIEGHMQPAGAALEIEVARMVSKAAVRGAVDTHFHLDHTFGNIAYAEQRIPILAHEKVTTLMKEQYAALKGADKAPLLAPHEKKLAQAADGTDKKRKEVDLATWKWMYDAIDAGTLAYPNELLATADLPKRIDLGGMTAVIEFHPGHTATDVIVRVPEHDLVFAGDLLFNHSYPVALDADMIAWRKVLDRFAGYSRRTRFVPGHGAVCGRETVAHQSALFDDLRAHAEKMIRAGASVDEAERRYAVPQRFQGYGLHSWDFTVGAAMRSYFTKLSAPLPVSNVRISPTI
ncbi:MAG: MBL fold metallo-hydrolase [Acidobacteria bacterium]|nr:MBL fold metallo-hydrolase [Acidobacteriota bacterium]